MQSLRLIFAFGLLAAISIAPLAARTRIEGPRETISISVSEGTTLSFDISPDGRWIVFDLLGQLWLISATGGTARPITDAVRDVAEDLDLSFSPDGRRVLFRGERNGRTGLWLLTLDAGAPSGGPRQLTQLANPDGYDGNAAWSPDGRSVAFASTLAPDSSNSRWRSGIFVLDVDSGATRELSITGLPSSDVSDPAWVEGGKRIAFVTRVAQSSRGGRVWIVSANGGQASPLLEESVQALAPTVTTDGRFIAYFAPGSDGRMQVWLHETNRLGRAPLRLTNHADVTPTRIRWFPNESALLYSADGRLWKVAAAGGPPTEIPFTAELSITRQRSVLPSAHFPEPGQTQPARGFMGLALSPDGRRIGMLALGKLWIIPLGGRPHRVTGVPFEATSLAWSSDGTEVAWSAGAADHEDLFATNVTTGATRRVTALTGREAYPAYSPDGRYLAFVHVQGDEGVLRVVEVHAANISDPAQTRSLGSIGTNWTSPPQWSPQSDGLLVCGVAKVGEPTGGTFVSLSGERKILKRFPDAPIFLRWTPQHSIFFVRHDRLWRARFDSSGLLSEPEPLGTSPALYQSTANDGTMLFFSEGGLRLRSPDGREQHLGWPISYTPPVAAPTLIRNVRIIDGTGTPVTAPRDILIAQGRIKRIAPSGTISAPGIRVLDGGGRVVIPGLMDLHAHT
jgi:Tol biopolymer transport system component